MALGTAQHRQQKPLLGYPLSPTHPYAQGLVALWTLSEGAGGTVSDATGNPAQAGTLTATGATWGTAQLGSEVVFAGTTGHQIDCGLSSAIGTLTQLTVIAWVRPTVTTRCDWAGHIGSGAANFAFGLVSGIVASKFSMYVATAVSNFSSGGSSQTLSVGQLVCAAGTYDGTTVSVYVNGVLGSSAAPAIAVNTAAAGHFTIGSTSVHGATGGVSAVFLYNRALSPAEIEVLFLDPFVMFPPRRTGLVLPSGDPFPAGYLPWLPHMPALRM